MIKSQINGVNMLPVVNGVNVLPVIVSKTGKEMVQEGNLSLSCCHNFFQE